MAANAACADGGHAHGDGQAISPRGHRRSGKSANLSNPDVRKADGLDGLKISDRPVDILRETKAKMRTA